MTDSLTKIDNLRGSPEADGNPVITGLDTWLETSSFFGFWDNTRVAGPATLVTINDILIEVEERDTTFVIDQTESGSFFADPTKVYGIQIGSSSFASDFSSSDFLNTGTFGFTNLNGASFSSGSGTFLSAGAGMTVPAPSSLLLMSLGLLGLARRR